MLALFPSFRKSNGYYRVYREYQTIAGRCDLFMVWENGAAVVEFKRHRADEAAVSQALRYCGAFDSLYGIRPQAIIAAPDFSDRAIMAALGAGALCVVACLDASAEVVEDLPFSIDSKHIDETVVLTHCYGDAPWP